MAHDITKSCGCIVTINKYPDDVSSETPVSYCTPHQEEQTALETALETEEQQRILEELIEEQIRVKAREVAIRQLIEEGKLPADYQ